MPDWLGGGRSWVGSREGGHLCASTSPQVNAHPWRGPGPGRQARQVGQVEPALRLRGHS